MTNDEIAQLCQQAGMAPACWEAPMSQVLLVRFAVLVAAAEREACAQIVERNAAACDNSAMLRDVLMSNAAAIRKRGEDENIS